MLPEVGASELIVIAIVALIVVGPKDLPVLLRKVGQFMNRMRGMAAEFRASFDEMARQSELDDLRKEVEALRRGHVDELRSIKADADDLVHDIDRSARGLDDAPEPAGGPAAPTVDASGDLPPSRQPIPAAAPEPLPAAVAAPPRPTRSRRSPRIVE